MLHPRIWRAKIMFKLSVYLYRYILLCSNYIFSWCTCSNIAISSLNAIYLAIPPPITMVTFYTKLVEQNGQYYLAVLSPMIPRVI